MKKKTVIHEVWMITVKDIDLLEGLLKEIVKEKKSVSKPTYECAEHFIWFLQTIKNMLNDKNSEITIRGF